MLLSSRVTGELPGPSVRESRQALWRGIQLVALLSRVIGSEEQSRGTEGASVTQALRLGNLVKTTSYVYSRYSEADLPDLN